MYLFFDTETSDLPKNWKAPASNTANWPRIVQLAWVMCDSDGNVLTSANRLIKPDGFTIAPGAFKVHGISTEFAQKNGVPLLPVLAEFSDAAKSATVLVAHNISFDSTIVSAEYIRAKLANPIAKKTQRCTMKESTDYCRLPGKYGYKWPTLTELYATLFDQEFEDAHDAISDCLVCMQCYFRLRELGVMA